MENKILWQYQTTDIWTYNSVTLQFECLYTSGFPTKYHLIYTGDFNNDGKTDLLTRGNKTNNSIGWYQAILTGKTFIETQLPLSFTPNVNNYIGDQILIADYNGDGKSDIAELKYLGGSISSVNIYYKILNHSSYLNNWYVESNQLPFGIQDEPGITFTFDADGDGRSDIFSKQKDTTVNFQVIHFNRGGKERLLQKVKNGLGFKTEFVYKRLTENSNFYNRGPLTNYPINSIQPSFALVSQFKTDNGIGGFSTIDYQYEKLNIHRRGKGIIGFNKLISIDNTSGFKTILENEFSLSYFANVPKKTQIFKLSDNSLISESNFTNIFTNQSAGISGYWYYIREIIENNYFEKKLTTLNFTYDNYNNLTQKITDNNAENLIENYVIENIPGIIPYRPLSSTTIARRKTESNDYIVSNAYLYHSNGKLSQERKFNGLPKEVVTDYQYNIEGNRVKTIISAANLLTRQCSTVFDNKGRYPTISYNELNQPTETLFDKKFGKLVYEKAINTLITTYEYDSWGRLKKTNLPQGISINESYGWDINPSEGTTYFHLISHPGKPDVKIWYDHLGRERKRQIEGFANEWITTKTTYDVRGNIYSNTAPYKANEAISTSTKLYDNYNRLQTVTNTFGTTTNTTLNTYNYSNDGNLTCTTTDPATQVSTKITDMVGKLISATDNGGTLLYSYYSNGKVKKVNDGLKDLVITEYDEYSRQNKLTDLNAGITQYEYDAYGQLRKQTSALNQITNLDYDVFGRVITSYGHAGLLTNEYYLSNSGTSTNQIKKITGFSNDVEEFTYDPMGRILTDKITFENIAYTNSYLYNTSNDVTSITYPENFTVNSIYDANGYLVELKNGTTKLFENLAMTGLNQYKSYKLGNTRTSTNTYYFNMPTNYSTPGIQNLSLNWNYQNGNLNSRVDGLKNKTEIFTYDPLNRLKSSYGIGITTTLMDYSANGNLTQKSDAGNYVYHSTKVNAVERINSSINIPSLNQAITYTPFFQPQTISEGNNQHQTTFAYGADEQRIKSVSKYGTTVNNTRYYLGNYEKDITGTSTKHIYYFNSGESLIAVVVRENNVNTFNYIYADHLGSILAVSNSSGFITSEQNFDAWGRKRNPTNWTYSSVPVPPTWLYRGFTGHEHFPNLGLINMNGRMYDPVVGRMLSVDNHIQMPDFTQNYNRYSYALNNPLKYTDPDGEFIVEAMLIGAAIGVLTNGITNHVSNQPFFQGAGYAAFMGAWAGGVSFGIGGMASGLNGVSKIAFQTIGHANLGGMVSAMSGGTYSSGAFSGAFGSLAGNLTGSMLSGVSNNYAKFGVSTVMGGFSGGVSSEIAGGNFWDGARNGMISAGLNHGLHLIQNNIYSNQLKKVFESYPMENDREISPSEAFSRVSPAAAELNASGDPNYQNACATRLSLAFAKAGVNIPRGYGGLMDVNGNRIIVSASQMYRFMSTKYGDLMSSYNSATSKNGIYIGLTKPNQGFSGHVTIMKTGFRSYDYSNSMKQMNFWSIN